MSRRSLILAAAVAVSAIWSAAAHSQSFTDPSGKTQPSAGAGDQTYSGGQPMATPPSLPDIPPVMPGIYSQHPPPGLPRYAAPTSSPGQFAPVPNSGPVTGYGPGGMAPMPGAPPNPPYSYGPPR